MRSFINSNSKKIRLKILLLFLVTVFLAPSVHSHDSGFVNHDDIVHHVALSETAPLLFHEDEHTSFMHAENLFILDSQKDGVSRHDHDANPHYHLAGNLIQRVSSHVERQGKAKPVISVKIDKLPKLHNPPIVKIYDPSFIPNQPFLDFIRIATALPPPAA